MQMSDAEILRRYKQNKGKKQIRVLAELNAVSVAEMALKINELMDAEKPKAAIKQRKAAEESKAAGVDVKAPGKKRGPKPKEPVNAARVVVEAVILRLEEVEHNMNAFKEQIRELTEKQNAYLDEWGQLTEWLKANE